MNIPTSAVVSLIPLVLGGIFSYFKPFLEDQREFKKRGARMLAQSNEKIAKALLQLVQQTLSTMTTDDSMEFANMERGDGAMIPDPYGDVASSISQFTTLKLRVSARLTVFRACYGVLLAGVVLGVVALLVSFFSSALEVAIIWICVGTVAVQVFAVVLLYILIRRSEDDEELLQVPLE